MTCLCRTRRDAFGDADAARADADQRDVVEVAVALEDLVGDARQRALDARGVHHLGHDDLLATHGDGNGRGRRDDGEWGTAPRAGNGTVAWTTSLRPLGTAIKEPAGV